MSKVDPRSKLFLVAAFSTLGVVYRDIVILLIIFGISIGLALLFRVDMIRMYHKLKRFIKLIVGISVLQSIFTFQGTPLIQIGSITLLTSYGVEKGVEFILRVSIILILGCMLATSSQREITQGLVQLRVPYELAFMSTLGTRFLPIFSEEFVDSLNALMLRGVNIKKLSLKKKVSVYTYILAPVVISSYLRAKDMAIAMELRGFRLSENRTNFLQLKLRKKDYCLIIISILVVIVGVIGRYL